MATPNLEVLRTFIEVQPEFDFVDRLGICNCRKIAGSQTYSQHSWCNALDIHFTDSFSKPATGEAKRAGDRMRAKILDEFGPDINEMIWQTTNHWDHIHVSPWPKGWLTPPCDGGAQRIKFKNGTTANAAFPQTIEWSEDMVTRSDKADNGNSVLKPVFDKMVAQGVMSVHTQPGGVAFNDEIAAFMDRLQKDILAVVERRVQDALKVVEGSADGLTRAEVEAIVESARLHV